MNTKRKAARVNAVILYLTGLLNLYYARLGVTAFCAVMGTHWLLMGRRYYR